MPTNSIQRYANKEEIDQAYQEIRAYIQQLESIPFFCSCLDLKFDRSKVSEVILDPPVSDFSTLEERRLEAFFSLVIKPQLFDREAEILKENLLFARCELPSFDWRGKRFPSIRIAAIHAGGAVVAWLLDYKHWLSEEWDRVSDCHVRDWIRDSFPISDADWDLLWDRWKLEYSRLLRDLPLLTVDRTDPTTTPRKVKGKGGRPRKGSESNKDLLIGILLTHHRYNLPGKDLNTDPISTKDACKQLEKSSSVLSNTWPGVINGLTYSKYRVICRNYRTLEKFLKAIDSREGYLERTNNEDAIGYAEE